MALLIPNIILDSVVCDICYKYLSAIPVKVFPNTKVTCGRCDVISSKEKGGIISPYTEVAMRSLFRCINRFDGCKALLTTSDVLQHEEICISKSYECPICMEEISSYLMIRHFKNTHYNFLLSTTTPQFVITKIDSICYHFLYNFKNYLVFVKFSSDLLPHKNVFNASLNCMLLGDCITAKIIKPNIIITYGNVLIKRQINCEAFPSDRENGLNIELNLNNSLLNVTVSLEMPESVVAIPAVTNINYDWPELKDNTKEVLLNLYFKEREELEPNCKNIVFNCFMCSTLSWYKEFVCTDVDKTVFTLVSGKYYLVCYICSQATIFTKKLNLVEPDNRSLYCKWLCGEHETMPKLKSHEEVCQYQIPQQCPVKSCKCICRLNEIKEHFKNKHLDFPAPVFGCSGVEGEKILLKPNCNQKIIFIQSHVYISIEFVWEQPFWNVYLTCELPNAIPTMIILNEKWKFIVCIKKNGKFRHLESLYYFKCFLRHPERQQLPMRPMRN